MNHFDKESIVHPLQLAAKSAGVHGVFELGSLTRLTDLLARPSGQIEVTLHFALTEERWVTVQGEIRGQVWLVCQRCFGTMAHEFKIAVKLMVVGSEAEAKQLPPEYDPWLVAGEEAALLPLVEEELLLSLPLVPKHEPRDCPVQFKQADMEKQERPVTEKPNPFADLKKRLKGE